ncbi:MAG: MFS transporter [Pelolinea sp.]|nr:MFS transporter [Pelolinea sp.]
MKRSSKYRWVILGVFFFFMLLHQTDKMLINPMATQIYREWQLTDTQWGAISTAALVVGSIFYPLWGYLYDCYARSKLLALASFIWGSTTWLSAIAPTFNTFLASRASTGVDDSSYPGLYSLIADYFAPGVRGKIYGLLQLTQPLGYMIGLILATTIAVSLGWRNIFFITGGLGILMALIILLFVKDVPRGNAEPEFENVEQVGNYHFEWSKIKGIVRKRSLIMMNLQGFFGAFPWNTIIAFMFIYLSEERGYAQTEILMVMGPAILVMASGFFIGGAAGDFFFKRTRKGRLLVAFFGVLLGALLLFATLNIPLENKTLFAVMMGVTALLIPISSANVTSTVNDVALPEIRSTALSIQYFIESSGAALAPLITGVIADTLRAANNPRPRQTAILIICITAWIFCGAFYLITTKFITGDIEELHRQLKARAANK